MKIEALFTMTSFYTLVLFFLASVVLIYFSPKRWHGLFTIFIGLLTAFIDAQSSEVSFSILLLISFGFFLGFTKPSLPLRTGLLLGVWLPSVALIHQAILGSGSSFFTEGVLAFVAFIPAIAGSYLGALTRKRGHVLRETADPVI
jgi:hypothetical protein